MIATEPTLFNLIHQPNILGAKPVIQSVLKEGEAAHLFHSAGRISQLIRKMMFFPFCTKRSQAIPLSSAQLFWETPYYDRDYPFKKEIREHFDRFEQIIEIEKEGKKLQLKCLVIEPKSCPEGSPITNHLIVQGNTSNLENNTPGIIPFLESYLKERKKDGNTPLGRFIIFNHYDNEIIDQQGRKSSYLPGDMDEWGFLFKKTIESLTHTYGRLKSISAHSLGNIPITAQFKHYSKEDFEELFPQTLLFSKGPSSFYEVSKNVPFQLSIYPYGWFFLISPILYLLAKATGWTIELDETLVEYLKKIAEDKKFHKKLSATNIIISEVKHDYYFPGKASMCASKKIQELEKTPVNLYRVSFNPPPTRTTKQGQHNYNPGSLQRQYVYKEKLHINKQRIINSKCPREIFEKQMQEHNLFLHHGESLPDLVLRCSLI